MENLENPEVMEIQATAPKPTFSLLVKGALKFLGQHWFAYIKMTFVVILPILIIGSLIFFIPAALGQPATPEPGVISEEASAPTLFKEPKAIDFESESYKGTSPFFHTEPSSGVISTDQYDPGFSMMGLLVGAILGPILLLYFFILIYQFIVMLAFTRLTAQLDKGEEIHYGGILKWAFKKFFSYLLLLIRIFFYTWAWLPIVLTLGSLVSGFVMSAMNIGSQGLFTTIQYILGLLGLLMIPFMIFVIVRFIRTVFSVYALADLDCSSKEALQVSVALSKGHWWKIVAFGLSIGIVIGLINLALTFGVSLVSDTAGGIASLIFSIMAAYYTLAFYMGFYRMLQVKEQ